ncbi:MAG: WecB/TagA/CpsF family glycosyltransferase [Anaerolineae bacterium]|nr:WecB/TagA/CpsF family glycosyltransferase [Anaerolineae bacterium]
MANRRLGTQSRLGSPRVGCTIFQIPVHDVSFEETVAHVAYWIDNRRTAQIATVNPEFLVRSREEPQFRAALQKAALCIPDGIGVLWAARWQGTPLRERVAGSDLVPRLSQEAARTGWRVFFLGAAPGVADQTARILTARFPGLTVAGTYSGSPAVEEDDDIVSRIQASQADLLFVAYGAPNQDLWLSRNLVRTGAWVGIGVGGSFDFITGLQKRAPSWVQNIGMEWLYRLVREPWRWRRQLALPRYVWLILRASDRGRG